MNIIDKCSGHGLVLKKGQRLKIIDIEGEQVSDFFCFMQDNPNEYLSSGRTIDYMEKILLTKGDTLYSSLSRPMVKIIEDTVGRHDFLLTPCSKDTFKHFYGEKEPRLGCEGNLLKAFDSFGIKPNSLPSTFNIFMNVEMDNMGRISVKAPHSQAGDFIVLEALNDLFVGLTACSALQSNNGSFKPIGFEVIDSVETSSTTACF